MTDEDDSAFDPTGGLSKLPHFDQMQKLAKEQIANMARDTERIDRILSGLRTLWMRSPRYTLMEILDNALHYVGDDNMPKVDDDTLEKEIQRVILKAKYVRER